MSCFPNQLNQIILNSDPFSLGLSTHVLMKGKDALALVKEQLIDPIVRRCFVEWVYNHPELSQNSVCVKRLFGMAKQIDPSIQLPTTKKVDDSAKSLIILLERDRNCKAVKKCIEKEKYQLLIDSLECGITPPLSCFQIERLKNTNAFINYLFFQRPEFIHKAFSDVVYFLDQDEFEGNLLTEESQFKTILQNIPLVDEKVIQDTLKELSNCIFHKRLMNKTRVLTFLEAVLQRDPNLFSCMKSSLLDFCNGINPFLVNTNGFELVKEFLEKIDVMHPFITEINGGHGFFIFDKLQPKNFQNLWECYKKNDDKIRFLKENLSLSSCIELTLFSELIPLFIRSINLQKKLEEVKSSLLINDILKFEEDLKKCINPEFDRYYLAALRNSTAHKKDVIKSNDSRSRMNLEIILNLFQLPDYLAIFEFLSHLDFPERLSDTQVLGILEKCTVQKTWADNPLISGEILQELLQLLEDVNLETNLKAQVLTILDSLVLMEKVELVEITQWFVASEDGVIHQMGGKKAIIPKVLLQTPFFKGYRDFKRMTEQESKTVSCFKEIQAILSSDLQDSEKVKQIKELISKQNRLKTCSLEEIEEKIQDRMTFSLSDVTDSTHLEIALDYLTSPSSFVINLKNVFVMREIALEFSIKSLLERCDQIIEAIVCPNVFNKF